MKASLCRILAALLCVGAITGCSANTRVPTGCLTTISAKQGNKTIIEPVWLDPDAGTITPVCDEETHGADCPFYGMDDSVRSYLTQEDGVIYYFTESTADHGEKTAVLREYSVRNGKTKEIDSRTDTLWRSKTMLKDGYLFQWERDADDERYAVTCMALSDRTREKYAVAEIPQEIVDRANGADAYYLLNDAAGYPCGFYTADWKLSRRQAERTLLFYDGRCRITGIWFEPDAIYWRGQMRFDPDSEEQTLFRYDTQTGDTTEVCSLYSGTQMVGNGDFFYYIEHMTYPDGDRESRYVFSRLRKSTGESKILDTLPVEWKADGVPRAYGSWILIRLTKPSDGTEGFYCWNADTGEAKLLPAQVTKTAETKTK